MHRSEKYGSQTSRQAWTKPVLGRTHCGLMALDTYLTPVHFMFKSEDDIDRPEITSQLYASNFDVYPIIQRSGKAQFMGTCATSDSSSATSFFRFNSRQRWVIHQLERMFRSYWRSFRTLVARLVTKKKGTGNGYRPLINHPGTGYRLCCLCFCLYVTSILLARRSITRQFEL